MSRSNWRYILAAGGLATVAVTAALLQWSWWYASPEDPHIPSQEAAQGPEAGYQPGGAACDPKRLNALPSEKAPTERERCAYSREEHRIQQAQLAQARRANDLSEGNLRLAAGQARIGFVQTWATIAAFIAAGLAAVFAGIAVFYAKKSAEADNDALNETRTAAEDARKEAVEQAKRVSEQLRLTDQTMQFTAKSAYAMSDTARETRRLVAAMQTSANASQRQADTAEEHGKRRLRAYVSEIVTVRFDGPKNSVWADVEWVNSGSTPARNLVLNVGVSLAPDPDPGRPIGIAPNAAPITLVRDSSHTVTEGVECSPQSVSDVLMGRWTIIVVGIAKYDDVFGEPHTTAIRYAWRGGHRQNGRPIERSENGNYSD